MDIKSEQQDYKLGQRFKLGAKRFQIEEEITNRDRRDYIPAQGFQIGAGITNRSRTLITSTCNDQVFREVPRLAISQMHQYSVVITTIIKENTNIFFGFPLLTI